MNKRIYQYPHPIEKSLSTCCRIRTKSGLAHLGHMQLLGDKVQQDIGLHTHKAWYNDLPKIWSADLAREDLQILVSPCVADRGSDSRLRSRALHLHDVEHCHVGKLIAGGFTNMAVWNKPSLHSCDQRKSHFDSTRNLLDAVTVKVWMLGMPIITQRWAVIPAVVVLLVDGIWSLLNQ